VKQGTVATSCPAVMLGASYSTSSGNCTWQTAGISGSPRSPDRYELWTPLCTYNHCDNNSITHRHLFTDISNSCHMLYSRPRRNDPDRITFECCTRSPMLPIFLKEESHRSRFNTNQSNFAKIYSQQESQPCVYVDLFLQSQCCLTPPSWGTTCHINTICASL